MTAERKRLADLKPGDHLWWEGDIECIESIDDDFGIVFVSGAATGPLSVGDDGDGWVCPSEEEVRADREALQERRRAWQEGWPGHVTKCMAAARRAALALGKDPELAEKQMKEQLDRENRAFEEKFS